MGDIGWIVNLFFVGAVIYIIGSVFINMAKFHHDTGGGDRDTQEAIYEAAYYEMLERELDRADAIAREEAREAREARRRGKVTLIDNREQHVHLHGVDTSVEEK
jgi:hypothetical protein